LDQTTLKELLFYNPDTGVFTWTDAAFRRVRNKKAGSVAKPYIYIRLFGKTYAAHRLAFLYMTGNWPTSLVDHKNRNPVDNSWENLREITYSGNMENQKIRQGFYVDKRDGRFYSEISVRKKKIFLGGFDSEEEAHQCYLNAKKQHHVDYYGMD